MGSGNRRPAGMEISGKSAAYSRSCWCLFLSQAYIYATLEQSINMEFALALVSRCHHMANHSLCSNMEYGGETMTYLQQRTSYELMCQGLHDCLNCAAWCWEHGLAYHLDSSISIPQSLRRQIEQCNREALIQSHFDDS